MMFLVRSAFWIAVVIMLIPVDEEIAQRAPATVQPIGALEAVSAAQSAFADVNGFCGRNPDVCAIGGRVATTFALKARTGAEMLADFVDSRLGEAASPDPLVDHGTLTPSDLAPGWRGADASRET